MIWTTPHLATQSLEIATTQKLGESRREVRWEDSVELTEHKSSVRTLAFSPDGSLLATYSADNTICLWDTATGGTKRLLKGSEGLAKSLSFSTDGKPLAHELCNGDIQV